MVAKSKRKLNPVKPTPRLVGGAYVAKADKSSKVLGGGGKAGGKPSQKNVSRIKKGNSSVSPTIKSNSMRQSQIKTNRKIGTARTSKKTTVAVGRVSARSLKQRSRNGGRQSPRRSVDPKLSLPRVEKRSTNSSTSSTISSQVDDDVLSSLASDKAPTLPSTGKGPNRYGRATIRESSKSEQPIQLTRLTRKEICSELTNPDSLEAKASVAASNDDGVVPATTSASKTQPSIGNDTNPKAANFKSFDESVYTYATYTTAGSYVSLDNRAALQMLVEDAATGIDKMVPQDFKDSVKDNVDRTKRVFDLSDISGTDLATSAKEISIVTKDVVVQETTSFAAWSMPLVADTITSMVQGIASAASGALADKKEESADNQTELPTIDEMSGEECEAETQADSTKAFGIDQTNDQMTDQDQKEKFQTKEPELSTSIEIQVHGAESGNQTKEKDENEQVDQEEKQDAKVVAAEEEGQEMTGDMAAALRQIDHLDELKESGHEDDSKPSKSTGKKIAKSFTKVAKTTTKTVGSASNALAKTSKRATGSALLSSSRAMGALGERLANTNPGDREAFSWAGGEVIVEDADSRAESKAHSRHTA
mmetsp:Transcript_5681/g.10778  ORF Transcript_5681/g.10778 Transcript_5681/m.10778 type:complete len:593 (+) Transcript_5681:148-1926(+)|eukprot:CAMPEP_0178693270 /NCGR_PEP_ID=MMETSP0699-20121125/7622_1 /TAXON_ID=265572 /ORGANISM="Extubocellulus spinifer, Strain CCMP396" /LENGTH=592 /DNA_ID=CAMNT_0020338669 /DNA_START=145 /DNA_END=1923 /DNA_ORIENTATION=+